MTIAMGQTFPKRRNVTLGSCALPPVSGILCMVCLLCGVSLVWTAGSRQQPIERLKKHKCMNILYYHHFMVVEQKQERYSRSESLIDILSI